jgi:hypothetical protein
MFDQNDWRFSRSKKKSEDFLKGAIDLHVHAGPHLFSSPRSTDPVSAAIDARDAGMRAIVYMDVFSFTVGTSWIVNQVVDDFVTYGGIILNTVYGGMNPRAVKTAVYYGSGARYVSFGAHSTYFQAYREGRYEDGKWILLREKYPEFVEEELSRCIRIPEGKPSKELTEILQIIADNPHIYLVTGHVSNDEALRLIDLSKEFGIKKVLVSNAVVENMSEAEIEKAIEGGAYLERCLAAHTHTTPIPKTHYYVEEKYRAMDEGLQGTTSGGVAGVAEQIKKFGADHFVIGTDFGVYTLPKPVEGMREFIACLMDCGLSDDEIRKVSSINPGKLLDLND